MLRRLFLVTTLVALSVAIKQCPNGSISSVSGAKCYHSMLFLKTFSAAEAFCNGFGGHLASVHNNFDYDRLVVSMNANLFWLGGHRGNDSGWSSTDGEWIWTDGSIFRFNNWAAGEPSRRGNCLVADRASLLWGAVDCERQAGFVCETDAPDAPTPAFGSPLNCSSSACEYKFFNYNKTWLDAEFFCINSNGHLISVHNDRVNNLIANPTFTDGLHQTELWLGGVSNMIQSGVVNNFVWTDGSHFDYSAFLPVTSYNYTSAIGITRVHGQKYGFAMDGWLLEDVSTELPFVCERPRLS